MASAGNQHCANCIGALSLRRWETRMPAHRSEYGVRSCEFNWTDVIALKKPTTPADVGVTGWRAGWYACRMPGPQTDIAAGTEPAQTLCSAADWPVADPEDRAIRGTKWGLGAVPPAGVQGQSPAAGSGGEAPPGAGARFTKYLTIRLSYDNVTVVSPSYDKLKIILR